MMRRKIFFVVVLILVLLAGSPLVLKGDNFGKNPIVPDVRWRQFETAHFVVNYGVPYKNDIPELRSEEEKEVAVRLAVLVEEAYKRVKDDTGFDPFLLPLKSSKTVLPPKLKIFIILYRDIASRHPLGPGEAVAYAQSGATIEEDKVVAVGLESSNKDIVDVLTHEFTHLFQYRCGWVERKIFSLPVRDPRLTSVFEMFAQVISGSHRPYRGLLRTLAAIGWLTYVDVGHWPKANDNFFINYVIAPFFLDYLRAYYGDEKFQKLFMIFGSGPGRCRPTPKGFEKAIGKVYGETLYKLYMGFRNEAMVDWHSNEVVNPDMGVWATNILAPEKIFGEKNPKKKADNLLGCAVLPSKNYIVGFETTKWTRPVIINEKGEIVRRNLIPPYSLWEYGQPILSLYGRNINISKSNEICYFAKTPDNSCRLVIVGKKRMTIRVPSKIHKPETPVMVEGGVILSAIVGTERNIIFWQIETGAISFLTTPGSCWDFAPSISDDGKKLVYVSVEKDTGLTAICLLDIESKQTFSLVKDNGGINIKPRFRPGNEKEVFFLSTMRTPPIFNVCSVNADNLDSCVVWTKDTNGVNDFDFVGQPKRSELMCCRYGHQDSSHVFSPAVYRAVDVDKPLEEINKIIPILNLERFSIKENKSRFCQIVEIKDDEKGQTVDLVVKKKTGEKSLDSSIRKEEEKEEKEIVVKKVKPGNKFHFSGGYAWLIASSRGGLALIGRAAATSEDNTGYLGLSLFNCYGYHNNQLVYQRLGRLIKVAKLEWTRGYFYPWLLNQFGVIKNIDPVIYYLIQQRIKAGVSLYYPLSVTKRVEFGVSIQKLSYVFPDWDFLGDNLRNQYIQQHAQGGLFPSLDIAFVKDTALGYRGKAFIGTKLRLEASWSGKHNRLFWGDFRKYLGSPGGLVLAVGAKLGIQEGTSLVPWCIGGNGDIRMIPYMRLMGSRIWILNFELRLPPLVRNFNVFGLVLGNIEGSFFFDIGRVGFKKGSSFNLFNVTDETGENPMRGGCGLDISLPLFGMPLHLAVGKELIFSPVRFKDKKRWTLQIWWGWEF